VGVYGKIQVGILVYGCKAAFVALHATNAAHPGDPPDGTVFVRRSARDEAKEPTSWSHNGHDEGAKRETTEMKE